jgi:hypothetical protein
MKGLRIERLGPSLRWDLRFAPRIFACPKNGEVKKLFVEIRLR